MIAGVHPDQPRLAILARVGWSSSQPTFLAQMTAEQFAGWHPDSGRGFLAPRLPQPFAQTTHVSALFSLEMVQGVTAPMMRRPRFIRDAVGWIRGWFDGPFGAPGGPREFFIVAAPGRFMVVDAEGRELLVSVDGTIVTVES